MPRGYGRAAFQFKNKGDNNETPRVRDCTFDGRISRTCADQFEFKFE